MYQNSIILAFAAVHIYFATLQVLPFVIYYVCGLLIPAFFLVTSILVKKEVNTNYCRTKFSRYRKWRSSKSKSSNEGNKDEEQGQEQQQVEQVHNPYQNTVSLHIHHWQIFYVLAFFTRYTHPVSQVASGIVIACYMQGICACKCFCVTGNKKTKQHGIRRNIFYLFIFLLCKYRRI
jgi:hypothetical protein